MTKPKSPPSDPSFRTRKPAPATGSGAMTSQRIAADLDAFQEAGGHIEVLTVTRPKDRADEEPRAPHAAPARPYSGARRGSGGRGA
jgi:hypothetical protein